MTALGNSVGTPVTGITANVIEVRTMDELNQLGEAGIKGKIVFFNHKMNPTFVRTFQAYGEAGIYRFRGPSMAAKYGAVGVIVRSLASNLTTTRIRVLRDSRFIPKNSCCCDQYERR